MLRTEIKGVVSNLRKMLRRADAARSVVQGTMQVLRIVAEDAARRLGSNPKLVRRAVGGPDETHAPLVSGQLVADVAWSSGKPEKVIVEAVDKLGKSSLTSFGMLQLHEEAMLLHVGLLKEIIGDLGHHYDAHDYQINEMAHNPTKSPTQPLQGSYAFHDGKMRYCYEATHEALSIAEDRSDAARVALLKAMAAAQDARSELESRKGAVQVAVRDARRKQHKQWVAGRFGKFGSTDKRVTDPALRRVHHTPESQPDHQWPASSVRV